MINVLPDGSAFCVGVIGNRPYEDPATCLDLAPDGQPKFWHSTDAAIWASAFIQMWGDKLHEVDEGLMIGWFANAMMRMVDGPTIYTPAVTPDPAKKDERG
jgi:hypothetical protein